MCLYGTYKWVTVINHQSSRKVKVDACIADEVQMLNDMGVVTLGSCCSHGEAGKPVEWENESGKWKGYYPPPHVLISEESVERMKELGYYPYPYYYADGEYRGIWQAQLRTGCLTKDECRIWHVQNKLPIAENLGIVAGS